MRADDEVDSAAFDLRESLAALSGGCRTGQQRHAKPRPIQKL